MSEVISAPRLVAPIDMFCDDASSTNPRQAELLVRVETACRWINGIHRVPNPRLFTIKARQGRQTRDVPIQCVQLDVLGSGDLRGFYRGTDSSGQIPSAGLAILVQLDQSSPEMTAAHEFWHLIQEDLLRQPGFVKPDYSRAHVDDQLARALATIEGDRNYRRLLGALRELEAIRDRLKDDPAATEEERRISERNVRLLQYLTRPSEWLARMYSQTLAWRYYWWGRRYFRPRHRAVYARAANYVAESRVRHAIPGRRAETLEVFVGRVARANFKRELKVLMRQLGWS